jgi:uncharacterized protein involved in exopolysaccharide biosynthesis
MSIIQFLRILWARAALIVACTVFTFLGGLVVTLLVQPRYEATARVMLNILKPDPVTGRVTAAADLGPYIDTQRELIKDYRVTAPVVAALNWETDPQKIAQYQARPASDNRDFKRWLAQVISDRTSAKFASGTIFEISFTSPYPLEAKVGAEGLRRSFMDYTLAARRQDATRNAQWFSIQADAARKSAEEAQLARAAYERANGIVMQGDQAGSQQDVESARLQALVGAAASAPTAAMSAPFTVSSQSSLQLAQIDAALAQNAEKLGPNHPQMQQLRAQRALVASVVAKEAAAARAGPSNTAMVGAIARELQDQKTRVIGQRDKIERLRQLQSEVDLRREQYKKTAERAADLTLEAGIADSGLSPIGVVVTPTKPAFPNKPLILGGALGLGAGLGLVLAVLVELLNRRVRGVEDLDFDGGLECLAVVGSAAPKRRKSSGQSAMTQPASLGASA